MKQTMKRLSFLTVALVMLFSLISCSGDEPITTQTLDSVTTEEITTEVVTEETKETKPAAPLYINPLTGLACDESLVGKRPLAIMLNNIKPALPQSGLSKCDIIYEALAEGGILRLEGIILDYSNAGVLGSVRSARPYYIQIATAYDALYAHFGGSADGDALIKRLGINNLNGMVISGKIDGKDTFYRDQERIKNGVSYEHTAFANGAGLAAYAAKKGYRSELNNKDFTAFLFDQEFAGIQGGTPASYVKIPHSSYSVSEFRYDATSKKYQHSQYNAPHIDGATGEQVSTENVFIIYANHKFTDSYGHREITLVGQGEGYYMNGGLAQKIVWKRSGETAEFSYYAQDGSELKVAPGRSYISIVDTATKGSVTIS
ncbi:MAG: DUF3048 domain-containing protein [Clostridia bacterium]|nr:DUF3048 domain-containing protein [Clostridia bacterium]